MKQQKHKISSKEIRGFYFSQLRGLKRTVSLGRKGTPRRKQWGVHIINPMRSHK